MATLDRLGRGGVCERVAVMLPNGFDLLTLVVAGAKVGGCCALINTNLNLDSLARSVQLGADRKKPVFFYGTQYQDQVQSILDLRLLETVSELGAQRYRLQTLDPKP